MKVFKVNTETLMWLGICPIDDKDNWWKQMTRYTVGFFVFIFSSMFFIGSLGYIYKFISSDLVNALYAVFQASLILFLLIAFISMFLNRDKVDLLIKNFQRICDESK